MIATALTATDRFDSHYHVIENAWLPNFGAISTTHLVWHCTNNIKCFRRVERLDLTRKLYLL